MYSVVEVQKNAWWRDDNGTDRSIINGRFLTTEDLAACARMMAVRDTLRLIQRRSDVTIVVVEGTDSDLSAEDQSIFGTYLSDVDSEHVYIELTAMGYSAQEIADARGDELDVA